MQTQFNPLQINSLNFFKGFVLFFTLFSYLHADKQQVLCLEKLQKSHFKYKQLDAYSVINNQAIVVSNKAEDAFIKYDPFLGLGVIKTKKNIYLKVDDILKKKLLYGNTKSLKYSSLKYYQIGLSDGVYLNNKLQYGDLVISKCCSLVGIKTNFGVVQGDYLLNFLNTKKVKYKTLGFIVDKYHKLTQINPFFGTGLKVGDILISVDGLKSDIHTMMKKLNLCKKKFIIIEVKRNGKVIKFNIPTKNKQGGGIQGETFLESFGALFTKDLKVSFVKSKSYFEKWGLRVGDNILEVDKKVVFSDNDIRNTISTWLDDKNKSHYLLINRQGFSFFIKVSVDL